MLDAQRSYEPETNQPCSQPPEPVISHDSFSIYLTSRTKRVFDLIGATALIVVFAPIMGIVAFMVVTTSRGPILFRQVRTGRAGEPFTIYKFRSMTASACSLAGVEQAKRDDDRITPLGRLLRKTSIDELPQLFNVLEGGMSLVGPRPHATSHDEFYACCIASYSWRFAARPGLTGLAQTRGARGCTPHVSDMERRIALDIDYLRRATLWMDTRILLDTFVEVFASSSAY